MKLFGRKKIEANNKDEKFKQDAVICDTTGSVALKLYGEFIIINLQISCTELTIVEPI